MTDHLSPENLARLEELAKAARPVSLADGKRAFDKASEAACAFCDAAFETVPALIARVKEQEAEAAACDRQFRHSIAIKDATISRLRALLGRCPGVLIQAREAEIALWQEQRDTAPESPSYIDGLLRDIDAELENTHS